MMITILPLNIKERMSSMKKIFSLLLCALMMGCASAASLPSPETLITLSDDQILVDGAPITENPDAKAYLAYHTETHPDVAPQLQGLQNRVITITDNGAYRITGSAQDAQIAVKADEKDHVRLILDHMEISCRTAPAIVIHSAFDPRVPGQYGVTIHLADGSENKVTGSHTTRILDTDVKFDGAVDSLVSLGFEGNGKLTVDADNEGIEVKYGHMTINGGVFDIRAGDDPLNVSEDQVGTLTVNGGHLFSAVKPLAGGEGDGIDSNGSIIFNGGTIINLAHPSSQDSGIDSDMGSTINGGVVVGAGNMYDPIEAEGSSQLFMMLEFNESTDDLVVVTDQGGKPVFAYDFPHDYMYIAFSTPELKEGIYHVYLGGEIEGKSENGLYTQIDSYTPGIQMTHGGGTAQQRNAFPAPDMGGMETPQGGMPGMQAPNDPGRGFGGQGFGGMDMNALMQAYQQLDLNEILKDKDLDELLQGKDLNQLLTGFAITDLLTQEEIKAYLGDVDPMLLQMLGSRGGFGGGFGGFGGPRSLENSAEVATGDFFLSRENTGFTNLTAIR